MNLNVIMLSSVLWVCASFCAFAQDSASAPVRMIAVSVRQEVKKPGIYQLPENSTLTDAVKAAGGSVFDEDGTKPYAGIGRIYIKHEGQDTMVSAKKLVAHKINDVVLTNGDVVTVTVTTW